jgi:hypothetical protein
MVKPKAKRSGADWVVMGDGGTHCLRCGKREAMQVPMPVDAFSAWAAYVTALHAHCREGDAPTISTVRGWINGQDTGTSSNAIYRHMMGIPRVQSGYFGDYPIDPADFGRCYRLLALAPEWRARIGEMRSHGEEWAALAGAWDELTALYEEELPKKMAPKLYARMRELRSPKAVLASPSHPSS